MVSRPLLLDKALTYEEWLWCLDHLKVIVKVEVTVLDHRGVTRETVS